MAVARISVNIDGEVKQSAQKILSEIGMDLTTAIDLLLRTIVREERIPFILQTEKSFRNSAHTEYIKAELEKAKLEAADPNTKWLTHDEVMLNIAKRKEARARV
jgi:DNA-damage-inducible protein J